MEFPSRRKPMLASIGTICVLVCIGVAWSFQGAEPGGQGRSDPERHANLRPIPAVPEKSELDPTQVPRLWERLGSPDAEAAHEAVAVLATSGDKGIATLSGLLEKLAPAYGRTFSDSPHVRRYARLTWALSMIRTEKARQMLADLRTKFGPPFGRGGDGATGTLRTLEGEPREEAVQARSTAERLHAEYESAYRPGPHPMTKALARVLCAYEEVMAGFPLTEFDAYCRFRLSGLYQYTGRFPQTVRLLEETAQMFAGTEKELDAHLALGLTYLQGYHNPGKGIAWFEKALLSARRLAARRPAGLDEEALEQKWQASAGQGLERCRKELAGRLEADKTSWARANEGARCRLRPEKLTYPPRKFPGFHADVENTGSRELWLPEFHNVQEVEVDGRWYKEPQDRHHAPAWFGPDCQYYHIRVVLGRYWRGRDDGKPLILAPGKHVVRVAFVPLPANSGHAASYRVTSDPVEIEILSQR